MKAGRVGRLIAHPDGRTATANLVAVVVAWNTPVYPLYLWWVAGSGGMPWALLTMCSLPFFAAVPLLSRRSSLAGRLALPLVGTANTLFCTWIFGEAAGEQLFLLPCITLGTMLFQPAERLPMLVGVAAPMLGYWLLQGHYPPPPFRYGPAQYDALVSLNAASVGFLTAFLGLLASRRSGA